MYPCSYRSQFSQYWKDTWKTVKFPHRGEVFDVFVDKGKRDFISWSDIGVCLSLECGCTHGSFTNFVHMETFTSFVYGGAQFICAYQDLHYMSTYSADLHHIRK